MTASESTLVAHWQPSAQAVVEQLTDLFGARLVMGEADVAAGSWGELTRQLPVSATVVEVILDGAHQGSLSIVWAVSDTSGPASWLGHSSVREGLWEAISSGISLGFGGGVTVVPSGDPWSISDGKVPARADETNLLVAWEAGGDGVSLYLGFVLQQSAARETQEPESSEPARKVPTRPARLPALKAEPAEGDRRDLALIMDLPLRLTVEIGRTQLLIKDVLALGKGSVVELNRLAGEPVDVLVNGRLLAKGEVVVLPDGNFGVRMVEISGSSDRLRSLQDE
jgi:flagellar motor switch protein FliN